MSKRKRKARTRKGAGKDAPTDLISVDEAADILGLSVQSLKHRRFRKRPPYPFYKNASGRVRYSKADVLAAKAGVENFERVS